MPLKGLVLYTAFLGGLAPMVGSLTDAISTDTLYASSTAWPGLQRRWKRN